MSDEFKVGDVVVCINNKPDAFDPKAALLTLQRHYRVATTGMSAGQFCIGFRDLPADMPGKAWGWGAHRFRKLLPADEAFTRQMRALRPHDERVPA